MTEALNRAVDNGVKTLVVQPTHLMNGLEYTDLVNELADNSDAFEQVAVGEPLLTSDDDFKAVIPRSQTQQKSTMTVRPRSASWVTAQRLIPTLFTRKCRIC